MSSYGKSASVATFGDHEVISPPNELRKAISSKPVSPDDDPVARAEHALKELSGEFSGWMNSECERLDSTRQTIRSSGFNKAGKDALFHAAHDIKGEAATFGYPAVAAVADSLCRLLNYTPDMSKIPLELVDQHVDAVRAIIREYDRSDAVELSRMLTARLREVTDEFLVRQNSGRKDILAVIMAPPLAPPP